MAMKTSWTAYIKDQERKREIKQGFLAAVLIRRRLKEILQRKIDRSIESSASEESYESPNWALKQADSRGYERALREVQSLLED